MGCLNYPATVIGGWPEINRIVARILSVGRLVLFPDAVEVAYSAQKQRVGRDRRRGPEAIVELVLPEQLESGTDPDDEHVPLFVQDIEFVPRCTE